jgi:N-acetylmuramoyl-L-alanine amidase
MSDIERPMSRLIIVIVLVTAIILAVPSHPASAQSSRLICIDADHGGGDNGTTGGGILEKQLNLAVAVRLHAQLKNSGFDRAMTRTGDTGLGNTERAQLCNSAGAVVLISIHHNGGKNGSSKDTIALNQKLIDRALASTIVNAFAPVTTGVNSGLKQFASGLLIKSDMPATMGESYLFHEVG